MLSAASAADLYWNGTGASGSAGGGGGVWDTTATNWETAATGGTPVAWTNGDNGFLGGTAGTVDLQSSLTAGTLTVSTTGYTVSTSNASILEVSAIDSSVLPGGQFTVGVVLGGSGSLSVAAGGTVTSTASNTLTGPVTVSAGTLQLNDARSMSGAITVGSGATLTIQSNGNGGFYQPASLDVTAATVNSSVAASNRYHGIYTDVLTVGAGTSSISVPLFMNKTGSASSTLTATVASGGEATISSPIGNHPDFSGGSLVKDGAGTLSLTGGNIFTGPFTINAGTVNAGGTVNNSNPTATSLGNMATARAVTVDAGGTLTFTSPDTIGAYNYKPVGALVADGGTITRTAGGFNSIGDVELKNGGRLTSANGQNTTVNSFALNGDVTVSGTSASFIDTSGSSNNGIHLGTAGTTNVFDVGDVTSDASVDLTVSAALINQVFGAAAGLVKSGAGTMQLAGANTFSGNITINAGTLNAAGTVNNSNPTATSLGNMTTVGRSVTVNSGATLSFVSSDTVGQFNYASPVVLIADGGTITRVASANSFNAIGSVTLRNGGRLTTTNGNASTVGSFAINGGVIVDGTSGSFIDTLAGQTSNSYINLGTTTGSTSFDVAATGDVNADLTVSAVLGDRVLGGAAGLVKAGEGTMRMTASNTYTGGTVVRAGALVGDNNNAFGTSGTVTLNDASTGTSNTSLLIDASGGTLTVGRPITVANQGSGIATIGASANAGGNFATFSGAITLDRSATLVGPAAGDRTEFTGGIGGVGGVTVSTSGGTRIIFRNAANSYAGETTITAGSVLQLSDGTATSNSFLSDSADLTVDGTLNLAKGSNAETVGGLLGSGTVANFVGGVTSTLIVGGGDRSGTFSGSLSNPSGTLALTKTGTGTQVITGANTYTGGTTITAGTLAAGNADAFGVSGAISVGASGTLGVADGITFSRAFTLAAGGRVRTGDNSTVSLPSVAALAAWESESNAGDQTLAEILDASGSSLPTALTSAWTANPDASRYFSDILTLDGTGAGNTYVLSMEYSGSFGDMNIWYRQNITDPFTPLGTSFQGSVPWNGSFATVGQYGVDTTNGTVWVVTDHNSQFVVVPEPGAVGLLAVGLAVGGLVGIRRQGRRLG